MDYFNLNQTSSPLDDKVENHFLLSIQFWFYLIKIPVTIINIIGIFRNILLIVMLIVLRKKQILSDAGVIVLLNEAVINFQASVYTVIYTFTDLNSLPATYGDYEWVRILICLGWHGQFAYWTVYCASVFNEMILAIERYVAIVYPFHHMSFRKRLQLIIALNYIGNIIFNLPFFVYNDYDSEIHICFARLFDGIYILIRWYAVAWSVEAYIIPGLGLIFFNLMTIIKLKHSDKILDTSTSGVSSDLKNKASRLLVKTSITITISYFLTMTYINYFYVAQTLEGFYDPYDIRNVIGIGLATFHFSFNPFIVLFFLPGVRRFLFSFITTGKSELNIS